jgi:UDP-GlcNAc3NAcA epimerase
LKITTVIGARPQFIKAAVVSRAFKAAGMQEVIIHTGQHYDANMSDVFFDELEIPRPDFNLGIGGGTHGQNTGRMVEAIEKVILDDRPDMLMVYGDTDSTLAGALAAVKLHIPVAHVEAGLRSFNRRMPEEINRILTDHCAELLLAPTETAMKHLSDEGIPSDRCKNTGDVMYDAALFYGVKAEDKSDILDKLNLESKGYILSTVHRAENTDSALRLASIFEGFADSGLPVVLPLHPRTKARIATHGIEIPETVKLIEPVGYLDMVMLEKKATALATDSGGVQKEAFFHGVPCITLRDETEWVELVNAGWNRIVPTGNAGELSKALRDAPGSRGKDVSPYGNGKAGEAIVRAITEHLS